MDKNFETEINGLGFQRKNYPGAFTPAVEKIIKNMIYNIKMQIAPSKINILHLFSGVSKIGTERIDLECKEATENISVEEFIESDERYWDVVILDPPYGIKRKAKLYEYSRVSSVAANVKLRNKLVKYFPTHTDNIVWLDMCAPLPKNFKRKKLWFLFPGGYHTLRVLSWLINENIGEK